jgi:hypothetical protein
MIAMTGHLPAVFPVFLVLLFRLTASVKSLFLFSLFFAEAQPPDLQVRGTPARRGVVFHARSDR